MREKNRLFVYGTLKDPSMRRDIFNDEIISEPATLSHYSLREKDGYYFITSARNEHVEGELIFLSDRQLMIADQWEEIPFYQRVIVSVNAGDTIIEAWAYVRAETEGVQVVVNQISSIGREEVFHHIKLFSEQLQNNTLPYCDAYLMIPCEVNLASFENQIGQNHSWFERDFIEKLKYTCENEYNGNLAQQIRRLYMPMIEIAALSSDDHDIIGVEKASVILSVFEIGSYAVLNLIVPAIAVPLLSLLDQVTSNRIKIRDIGKIDFLPLEKYLLDKGIKMSGTPRVALFMEEKPEENDLAAMLICETDSPDRITGGIITAAIKENIAQYASAEIYASDICVLEIPRYYYPHYDKRLNSQILTLFIIELIQLQEAALKMVSNDVHAMITQKTYKSDIIALRQIETIIEEFSRAMLLWDINNFKYRTAQYLANEFSRKFEMNKKFDVFFQYKSVVEQLTQVHSNRINISETKLLNGVLLLLAFIQIAPVIFITVRTVVTTNVTGQEILSAMSAVAGCFIIWLIFRHINKRKITM